MNLPAHRYFVTATGTGVGKTYTCTTLLRLGRAQGWEAQALKPVLSGLREPAPHDDTLLLEAMGETPDEAARAHISPWRYGAPLSPHRAAELEGTSIEMNTLLEYCQHWLDAPCTPVSPRLQLIEGVGGVMVPLTYQHTVRDWIVALNLPVILVCGDYLGSLSHTLSALHCLHQVGAQVEMICVNQSDQSVEHANMLQTLRALSPYRQAALTSLPREGSSIPLPAEATQIEAWFTKL